MIGHKIAIVAVVKMPEELFDLLEADFFVAQKRINTKSLE